MHTYTLSVPSMHCNGCIKTITRALHELDASSQVEPDLAQHVLRVTSTQPREAVVNAILDVGHEVTA